MVLSQGAARRRCESSLWPCGPVTHAEASFPSLWESAVEHSAGHRSEGGIVGLHPQRHPHMGQPAQGPEIAEESRRAFLRVQASPLISAPVPHLFPDVHSVFYFEIFILKGNILSLSALISSLASITHPQNGGFDESFSVLKNYYLKKLITQFLIF